MINLILWNFPGEEGYPRLATILEIGFHGTTIKKIGLGSLGYIYIYILVPSKSVSWFQHVSTPAKPAQ